ncbi:MAG: C69 family dipeptidase [Infirmifilum sp.]
MCDTIVALKDSTAYKVTIFAKNSDREPNEAQYIEIIPRQRHEEDYVKCTYISVPQVNETYAVFLSRPWWMWGAEMGVNEFGVAIGNEAVFTKVPYSKEGLTGMDLVRLGLERAKTAGEALEVITGLIEEYGQGGNCSREGKLYYHNSFIISDPNEAWVLETAGKYWVAERVKDVRSISNALSISKGWDRCSSSLTQYVEKLGRQESFDFAKHFSDLFFTTVARGRERHRFTQSYLEAHKGSIDFVGVSRLLRSHTVNANYSPIRGSMRDICMHAGGPTRPSQTANSMIALLYEKTPIIFVTGTSSPCISLYKPVFLEAGLPDLGPRPENRYNPEAYWWIHERLHRKLLASYPDYAKDIRSEIEAFERELFQRAMRLREEYLYGKTTREDLFRLTQEAFTTGRIIDEKWTKSVRARRSFNLLFEFYWDRANKRAGIPT